MARLLIILLLVVVSPLVRAQDDPFPVLAGQVCACLQRITTEPPTVFARQCLRTVARENHRVLIRAYGRNFNAGFSPDLDALATDLAHYLASDCPFVQTLYRPEGELEQRWSDRPGDAVSATKQGASYAKNPPPDPETLILAERPRETIVAGTITALGKKEVGLLTADGATVNVLVPARLRRSTALAVGASVQLVCRREWRTGEERVVLVLAEIR